MTSRGKPTGKNIYNLTEKAKKYVDILAEGNVSGPGAIRKVYNVKSSAVAAGMHYQYSRKPNIIAYMRYKMSKKEIVDASDRVVIDGLQATKWDASRKIEVPDWNARFKAREHHVAVLKETRLEQDGTTPEESTYYRDWFIQENGHEPTAQELKKWRDKVIDVEPTDVQEWAFRSEKVAVSLMPKDFTDD